MPSRRVADVRFYFDADVLGLAKLLAQERVDFTYPGDPGGRIKKRDRPPCPLVSPSATDPEWIPIVAALGWVIITRDRHIQDRRAEINAVRDHGAKMLNFTGDEAKSTWSQLEIFMSRWRDIEPLIEVEGPFIYRLNRTGKFSPINLDP
jgi:hypothetical protein